MRADILYLVQGIVKEFDKLSDGKIKDSLILWGP